MDVDSDSYQLMLVRAKLAKLVRVSGRAFAECRRLRKQVRAEKISTLTAMKERDEKNAELKLEIEYCKSIFSQRGLAYAERDAAIKVVDTLRAERDIANSSIDELD
jgi:hypothetical protein